MNSATGRCALTPSMWLWRATRTPLARHGSRRTFMSKTSAEPAGIAAAQRPACLAAAGFRPACHQRPLSRRDRPPAHPCSRSMPGSLRATDRAPALAAPVPARSGSHLSQIDIIPARPGGTLVTFGDSITRSRLQRRGVSRSPDQLAERLQTDTTLRGWTIVNAGIGSTACFMTRLRPMPCRASTVTCYRCRAQRP
jgi:hypothetical protein